MRSLLVILILLACFTTERQINNNKTQNELHKIASDDKSKNELKASQKKLLANHNEQREKRKINSLFLDQKLCDYAQQHAEKMAKEKRMYHSRMQGLPGVSGENVAFGQKNETSVTTAWMNSPGHRSNILGGYNKVGFGKATDGNGLIYWCTVFSE